MLLSFLKAKRLNIFSQEILAEFDLNVLEIYYQLLLPLYKLNLLFERTNSNIGEVIPLLNMTIYGIYKKMDLSDDYKLFVELIIKNLKKKINMNLIQNII